VDFDPPKADRIVLPKGMILYFLEDHTLPLVNIQLMIKTGDIYDPPDKVGVAGLTGAVMRRGGTLNKSSDAIDEELEFMAAELNIGIEQERGTANLNLLRKDLDQGLTLFADILMHPAFEEGKLELTKRGVIEGILRRNDSPHSIAARTFQKLVYGELHPYGRESTVESIQRIQREDLLAFHRNFFRPNNVLIAVSGDIKKDELIRKLTEVFSPWQEKEVVFPPVPPVHQEVNPSINYIFKDIPQTTIRMGHLGVKRDNPDFFALSVMDDILGSGGFGSRLFQEVRTRQGLAYSAGSIFQPGDFEVGIFLAYSETKSASTLQAINAILNEIKRIREEAVSDEELKQAKDSFLNSFVFSFANPTQIVTRQMRLEYMGLPKDFLDTFRDRVAQVTKKDILRVAQQYLKPEGLIILAVGKQDEFDSPLSTLGKVHEIPLEETEPVTGG
jgi:predicted Zn-dependent peptidase